MLTLRMITGSQVEEIETFDRLQEALDEVRCSWMEDGGEGSPVYTITDEAGQVLAVVVRSADDAEVAITTFTSCHWAPTERHYCTYLLNHNGRYAGTRITCMETGTSNIVNPFASRVR
jgi:hypothetical protein